MVSFSKISSYWQHYNMKHYVQYCAGSKRRIASTQDLWFNLETVLPSVRRTSAADGFPGNSAEKDSFVTNARFPGELALHPERICFAFSVYSLEEQIRGIHTLLLLPVSYRSANYLRTTLRALQFILHFIHLSFLKVQLRL